MSHEASLGGLAVVAACTANYGTQFSQFDIQLRRYAKRHGFASHFAVPSQGELSFYQKATTIRQAAESFPPSIRWLWWADCDTVILDEAIDARDLLKAALEAAGAPSPSFVASYETWGEHEGGHPINTGSIFIRRDDAGRHILAKWEHACK